MDDDKRNWNGESNATVTIEFSRHLKGPHLFDIIEMIGKEETVKRIEKAIVSLIKKKPLKFRGFLLKIYRNLTTNQSNIFIFSPSNFTLSLFLLPKKLLNHIGNQFCSNVLKPPLIPT